jgi:hypothetical protein
LTHLVDVHRLEEVDVGEPLRLVRGVGLVDDHRELLPTEVLLRARARAGARASVRVRVQG